MRSWELPGKLCVSHHWVPAAPVHTEVLPKEIWGGTVKLLSREGMGVKNPSRGML